jgi:hypothetical protein
MEQVYKSIVSHHWFMEIVLGWGRRGGTYSI